jgi:hypothetical protein
MDKNIKPTYFLFALFPILLLSAYLLIKSGFTVNNSLISLRKIENTNQSTLDAFPSKSNEQISQVVPTQNQNLIQIPEEYLFYSNRKTGVSFYYPPNARVHMLDYIEDIDYEIIEINNDKDASLIDIEVGLNPSKISPKQWFELNQKNKFNKLTKEIAEITINGHPTYILGIPDTCISAPGLYAIVDFNDKLIRFHYLGFNKKPLAKALRELLETIAVDNERLTFYPISDDLIKIPEVPPNIECP